MEIINQRYLLFKNLDMDIKSVVLSIIDHPGVFTDVLMTSLCESH